MDRSAFFPAEACQPRDVTFSKKCLGSHKKGSIHFRQSGSTRGGYIGTTARNRSIVTRVLMLGKQES